MAPHPTIVRPATEEGVIPGEAEILATVDVTDKDEAKEGVRKPVFRSWGILILCLECIIWFDTLLVYILSSN